MTGFIDIGSNSVRLLYNKKKYIEVTQLSEDLLKTEYLQKVPMERTILSIKNLYDKGIKLGAEKIYVFATEAVRFAKNSRIFLEKLKKLDIDVDVISPEIEAKIGFLGAYTKGKVAILDIGGASSELIIGDKDKIYYSYSLNYGCVKLKDFSNKKSKKEIIDFIEENVKKYGKVPEFSELIGIGGTTTSLAAVILNLVPYNPEIIHNSVITYNQIEIAVNNLYDTPEEMRIKLPNVHPKRALVLPYGGFLLLSIMSYLKIDKIRVSENDNLEGYLKYKGINS